MFAFVQLEDVSFLETCGLTESLEELDSKSKITFFFLFPCPFVSYEKEFETDCGTQCASLQLTSKAAAGKIARCALFELSFIISFFNFIFKNMNSTFFRRISCNWKE
jgi:hypothetical protein